MWAGNPVLSKQANYAGALQKQCARGLMRRQEQRVNLTARGFDVMNTVLTELMP